MIEIKNKCTGFIPYKTYYSLMGYEVSEEKFSKLKNRGHFKKLEETYNTYNTKIKIEDFVKYLHNNNIKYYDWNKLSTFNKFIDLYTKEELKDIAIERTIIFLNELKNSLENISIGVITHNICVGNISPWYIFTFYPDSYQYIIEALTDEQKNIMNLYFWKYKIQNQ